MAADQHDWHSSLSVTDRYGTVRSIQEVLPDGSMSTAMAIEQAAYTDSASLDEYTATCHAAIAATATTDAASDNAADAVTGDTRIGSYTNCTPIADGVTSTVYRSSDRLTALKVITTHHPLPPHSPQREISILRGFDPSSRCIPLLDAFRDQEQQQVLAFPYKPLTLEALLARQKDGVPLSSASSGGQVVRTIFADVLGALAYIHDQGIIHRDVKPSAILLDSSEGPAYLSDFGTAWHPELSAAAEPARSKILDIGTGAYRAPEVLFVNKAYGAEVDVWGLGVMLAECLATPARPPFESRPAHEDGNQLGLILSIFKTLGTPTPETWPEAKDFQVSPFEMWAVFPQKSWREILPTVDPDWVDMIASAVRFSKRATAQQVRNIRRRILTQTD
ncbi:hypothetical protein PWT90_06803 [Aphanocladium album]|nr:hypothetical protein PWT90_06803 [Aphanocladium album]